MRKLSDHEKRRIIAALTGILAALAVVLSVYVYKRRRPGPETFQQLSNRAFGIMDKDLPTALALLDRAILTEPQNPLGYTNKAVILSHQELYADAAKEMKKALDLRLDKPEWYFFQGECLRKAGQKSEAEKAYGEALALYDAEIKKATKDFNLRYQREKTALILGDSEAVNRLIDDLPKYDTPPSATQIQAMMTLNGGVGASRR